MDIQSNTTEFGHYQATVWQPNYSGKSNTWSQPVSAIKCVNLNHSNGFKLVCFTSELDKCGHPVS